MYVYIQFNLLHNVHCNIPYDVYLWIQFDLCGGLQTVTSTQIQLVLKSQLSLKQDFLEVQFFQRDYILYIYTVNYNQHKQYFLCNQMVDMVYIDHIYLNTAFGFIRIGLNVLKMHLFKKNVFCDSIKPKIAVL